jgi:hypothetical protein|tara:strand:- start:680 stop:904 length:225 start_codon:yes stop_codon:yes gene_type:complete
MARKKDTTKGVIEPVKQNIIQGIKDRRNKERKLPKGLQIDTTTGEGANITKMKEGGYCRGAGAAIKGTKFEGVF